MRGQDKARWQAPEGGLGQEITQSAFSAADHGEFRARLRHETATLKRWFEERAFQQASRPTTGLELEAWLVDRDCLPAPNNAAFIAAVGDPNVVLELSKFNFELNADPQLMDAGFLERTHDALERTWRRCEEVARSMKLGVVATGILPTVRDQMLQLDWMSDAERYRALNQELMRLRAGQPVRIDIEGEECLQYGCDHIMLEAACTSLQAHLQVNQDEAARFYNASVIAAGPLLAASANSPFLYGKSLWAETRVPAFEQATAAHGFVDNEGREVRRVTLGTGYLRHSLLELFLENLSYPALLPALADDDARLPHLRLHNGTIWRWVRPIVGFDGAGAVHLRLEQRVMPAGPTIADSIANLALYFGMVRALARADIPPETQTSFEDARSNFYACAREGLSAQVRWGGKAVDVQALLIDVLLPNAARALSKAGVDPMAVDYYLNCVVRPRLISGLNGAAWQRSFVDCNGPNFQAMLERYVELQAAGEPVHSWTV
ncbi:MAG: glutamate-cysteine ligase family protein [Hyphomonadaceae bacterium]